ncbi:MAG: lysylphosphatidylglycerol synthase transmembrane domain-containing protein [Myxococcota bacterium]|nr:lysylphosphatidylglycerol synthase transmembrane domain-containing protein [Myxococcota bacterium]
MTTARPPEIGDPARRVPAWRDWRVLLGIAITLFAFGVAIRGIPVADVIESMRGANLSVLLGLSLPAYAASVVFRGLRWRHLTNPIAPVSRTLLCRGVAIGFMVNNLVPLRIGEVVRAWYVSRESGVSGSAVFGTVVLERVLDVVAVVVIALGALSFAGAGSAESTFLSRGAILLLPAGLVPLIGLVLLRVAPAFVLRVVLWLAKPLPSRVSSLIERILRNFTDGLGALSGGSHLFWIAFHSVMIWIILSVIPMLAGLLAFGIDVGSPGEMLMVSYIALGAVGVAVAIPSAPGFFGTYQLAFKTVLEQFGVESATALALGLVVWFVFWAALTVAGLAVMRSGGTRLRDLTRRAQGSGPG